jgi:Ni,Fe-hydrogenase III small subunit
LRLISHRLAFNQEYFMPGGIDSTVPIDSRAPGKMPT